MSHHAAYALPIEFLDVVLIEDSRPMQMILRSMLGSLRARRVRVFDDAGRALSAMVREPPNLIVTDWRMPAMSGLDFLRTLRLAEMAPLCFVPVIVITAHATHSVVQNSMRFGAHSLLVKPVAPASLLERIQWVVNDKRHFMLGDGDRYVIEGTREKLETQRMRTEALRMVRDSQDRRLAAVRDAGQKPARPKPAADPAPKPTRDAPRTAKPGKTAVPAVEEPLALQSSAAAPQPKRARGRAAAWGELR